MIKEFENLFTKQNEPIVNIITCFTDVVNGLKVFDRKFANSKLDNDCSNHMTRDWSLLSNLKKNDGGHPTFGDNSKGKIIGVENIGNNSSLSFENVLLFDNLKHKLLSVS